MIAHRRTIIVIGLFLALVLFLVLLPQATLRAIILSLLAQRALIGLLLVFSLLVLSLLWSVGERVDAGIFLYFNLHKIRSLWIDRLMFAVTQIGNGVFALVGAAFLYLSGNRRLAIEMILGVLTLWLVVELVKALTDRARPYISLVDTKVVGWRERGRSFPSGHTAQTFFLMALLIHHIQPGFFGSLALNTVAVLVGFTRIYVGVHYPRDVLGGAILGSVWGILAVLVDPYLASRLV